MTTESERAKQRGQHRKQHLFMRSLSLVSVTHSLKFVLLFR